jgi:hypothetical protein
VRQTWRAAALSLGACALSGCYIPGSGWTLRTGLDARTARKPALFVEMVDTRWDEWNRVAQCNVAGGHVNGVWSDAGAPSPAWSSPTGSPQPAEWQAPPVYPAPPLIPPVPPVTDTSTPSAPAPVESLPAAPPPPPAQEIPPAPPESSPAPPPPDPKPAEAPSGPVAGARPEAVELAKRRQIPDAAPNSVQRADSSVPTTGETSRRVIPAGGAQPEPERNRVQLGAPVVEELPEPYVPRNPLKAASPALEPSRGHTPAEPAAQRPLGVWQRLTSPLRAQR